MPFTLSHIAAVLPLGRVRNLSLTGLIAGSIVPDFQFLFQMREVPHIGHAWQWIVFFNIPVAFMFCVVFHFLLRDALIENLPGSLRLKFDRFIGYNWTSYFKRNKLLLLASICLGVISHLLLDVITHQGEFISNYLPVLTWNIEVLNQPIYEILQAVLSMLGLLYLWSRVISLPNTECNVTRKKGITSYWVIFSTAIVLILSIRLLIWPEHNSFWGVIIAGIGAASYAWLISSIMYLIYSPKTS